MHSEMLSHLSLSSYEYKLSGHFRADKLCCCLCVDTAELKEAGEKNHDQEFYHVPSGLNHHLRIVHGVSLTDELVQNSKSLSQLAVADETLQNLRILSLAREDEKSKNYIKCTVNADSDCTLIFNTVREKEAAKYYALYLHHKGKLPELGTGSKGGCVIDVRSSSLVVKFQSWSGPAEIHLETIFSKMVGPVLAVLI